jgi:hypothetical protein
LSWALDTAIVLRERVRERLGGEMTPGLLALIVEAEHAAAALSPEEFTLYFHWAWESLPPDEAARLRAMCQRRSPGDA